MPPFVTLVAAGIAALAAAVAIRRVRGSTAVPAAWWALAACLALAADAGAHWAGWLTSPAAAARVRLGVAALAVCPAMSLLGAKRPQHGVWQLIVATLAVVVAMPALSAWLVRPGSLPDVHLLGRGFLVVLAVVGWLNFVATSHGPAATAIAAGQLAFLRPFLPGVATAAALPQPLLDAAGACLVAAGAAAALARRSVVGAGGEPAPRGSTTVTRCIDPPFLALRDTLGAAWALRIAERFDTVAAARGWPCRLHFAGLDAGGDPADDSWHRDALRAFKALMHRFVDDAWLVRHGWKDRAS
ncbi:MAG: hypothetical protein WCR51_09480 [Planctomycetia bacterium]